MKNLYLVQVADKYGPNSFLPVAISYQWMFDYIKLFEIGSQWYVYVIAFLGIDFASYWSHRWNHEYNILWNKHIIHHSMFLVLMNLQKVFDP